MLEACVKSLLGQNMPNDLVATLIVVENDSEPISRDKLDAMAKNCPRIDLRYALEPNAGIPLARNRAMEIALESDPDWIGFIDDDEQASQDWLESFVVASSKVDCDVFQGPVEYIYPPDAPTWVGLPKRKHRATGLALKSAATSNTFMKSRLVARGGLNLRFDERLRFTGGSDGEFFQRARELGARICWLDEAVVYENVPEERTTLKWLFNRARRVAANKVLVTINSSGWLSAIVSFAPSSLAKLVEGLLLAPVGLLVAVVVPKRGLRLFSFAVKSLATGLGGLMALCGSFPQPYTVVDGY